MAKDFPDRMSIELRKISNLPYGENPGQGAAIYAIENYVGGLPNWERLSGKPASYNNWRDAGLANRLLDGFGKKSTAAIAKHGHYSGIAWGPTIEYARQKAKQCNPEANFGGVEVFTESFSVELAKTVKADADSGDIRDIIAAPGYEYGVVDILKECRKGKYKDNLRVFKTKPFSNFKLDVRFVDGAALVQELPDYSKKLTMEQIEIVSQRKPTTAEIHKLLAAEDVAWRVPSNAIVVGDGEMNGDGLEAFWTCGIGSDTKRIAAARHATDNANDFKMLNRFGINETARTLGAVAASDGFFPFPDGVEILAEAGISAILSTKGAMREKEVVKSADENNVALVLSSRRIFSH